MMPLCLECVRWQVTCLINMSLWCGADMCVTGWLDNLSFTESLFDGGQHEFSVLKIKFKIHKNNSSSFYFIPP